MRDRDPPLEAAELPDLYWFLVGEVSREGFGDAVADGGADRWGVGSGVGRGVVDARFKGCMEVDEGGEVVLAKTGPSPLAIPSLPSDPSAGRPADWLWAEDAMKEWIRNEAA